MNFQYKIRTADGKVVTGVKEAASRNSALQELREDGYQPIAVIQIGNLSAGGSPKSQGSSPRRPMSEIVLFGSVKEEEILVFTRDLLSIVHSGIPLLGGLQDAAAQIRNVYFRQILEKVIADVTGGLKLSDAFARHPKVFSDFYCNTMRAGEDSGRLEEIVDRLVKNMEKEIETASMIKNAVRYPVIVLCFLISAFVLITLVVIPRIAKVFEQFGTELPLPTLILIRVGDFTQAYGFYMLAGLVLSVVAMLFYNRTKQGAFILDSIRLRIPVMGSLFKKIAMSKFTSTLQSLYASGLMLPEALDISARISKSPVLRRALEEVANGLRRGKKMSEMIYANSLFPPLVVRMIHTGEKTGSLESMLGEVTRHYDREIDYTTKSLTTLIEPILTVCLSGMVLVLALGVFMPMWNVMKLFKQGAGM